MPGARRQDPTRTLEDQPESRLEERARWTYQGTLAPAGKLTWMTQSSWVIPIVGSQQTTYVYLGDHWYGNQDPTAPGKHNYLATYVFQPIVFSGTQIGLPTTSCAGSWTSAPEPGRPEDGRTEVGKNDAGRLNRAPGAIARAASGNHGMRGFDPCKRRPWPDTLSGARSGPARRTPHSFS